MTNFNPINAQMHEFQLSISSLEKETESMYNLAKEMLDNLSSAKSCLNEAESNANATDNGETGANLDQFKIKMSDLVYKECESLKNSLKKLNDVINDSKQFQAMEIKTRERFMQNIEEFDEKSLKKLLFEKSTSQIPINQNYKKLEKLIENAMSGDGDDSGEELVIQSNENQVLKCPITSKPISVPCKNSRCDHVYEREAILSYIKGKASKRCPFAGCKQYVEIKH